MRLTPDQLPARLAQGLASLYLMGGDEPLLINEALDALRARARGAGYDERHVFQVETGFDWGRVRSEIDNLSLFATRRLIEIRIPNAKPGDEGVALIVAYAQNPPPDTVLVLITGKLDKAAQATAWFTQVERAGVLVLVRPVEAGRLPQWIAERLRKHGLQPTPEAAAVLAERVEGNLLAAQQEIEKLALLHPAGPLDAAAVLDLVADSARYDLFSLPDACLAGDTARAARIIHGLQSEEEGTPLVLWALAREVRSLTQLAAAVRKGQSVDMALNSARVWESRKSVYRLALKRFRTGHGAALLRQAARIDCIIKGQMVGNPWEELLQLALGLAGAEVIRVGART